MQTSRYFCIDISTKIFKTTEERIRTEDTMKSLDKQMSAKIEDVIKKLRNLDASMKKIQRVSSEQIMLSRENGGKGIYREGASAGKQDIKVNR